MFLQLRLLMAATAIGSHATRSVRLVSAPNLFALNREFLLYLIERLTCRRTWTQSSYQVATGSGELPSAQGLPTGSWPAQTGRAGSQQSALESMVWRRLGCSMAVKLPLIGITQVMQHTVSRTYVSIPEDILLKMARFIHLRAPVQLSILRSP